jgi:hypothetical protein
MIFTIWRMGLGAMLSVYKQVETAIASDTAISLNAWTDGVKKNPRLLLSSMVERTSHKSNILFVASKNNIEIFQPVINYP